MSDDRFDGIFLNIAQQHEGIEPLLNTFFDFLGRKTDFFTGPGKDMAEKIIMKGFRAAQAKYKKDDDEKPKPAKKAEPKKPEPKIVEVTDEEEEEMKRQKIAEAEAARQKDAAVKAATPKAPSEPKPKGPAAAGEDGEKPKGDDEEDDPSLQKPNYGNGGVTDRYSWTQILQEVDIVVPLKVDFPLKSKDVVVKITQDHLIVGLKGHPPIIDGKLHKKVKASECNWTFDKKDVTLNLIKVNQMEWWKTVIEGDVEINTRKVQPENSKLDDLDRETRGMVEKMMYDTQRKQMGLPTSDDEKKQAMLDKFMKAHPEMDFSQAKIS